MKRFVTQALLFAALHYLVLLCLRGVMFLLAHTPPAITNSDWLVILLTWLEHVLIAPRLLLRKLWPIQSNSPSLILTLAVINSLVWGIAIDLWRDRRNRSRETTASSPPRAF